MPKNPDLSKQPELRALVVIYVWRNNPELVEEDGAWLLEMSEEIWAQLNAYVN